MTVGVFVGDPKICAIGRLFFYGSAGHSLSILQEAGTACEVESKNLRALPEIDSEPSGVTHSAEGSA